MATDAEFMASNVNMKKHAFRVMEILSKNKPSCSSHPKAEDMLKTYLNDPDVNRVRPKDKMALAPIHYAVLLEDLDLLALFKNSETVDVNIIYKKDGVKQGTILDLAVLTRNIGLEVVRSVLEMAGPGLALGVFSDQVAIPLVLEEAVKQDREELLFLLLKSGLPLLNHYSAALSCIVNNNVKIFNKLLAEIQEQGQLYLPPSFLKRLIFGLTSCD